MGSAMSANLIRAGFKVVGYDVVPQGAARTSKGRWKRGAQLPGSGQEMRHHRDVAAIFRRAARDRHGTRQIVARQSNRHRDQHAAHPGERRSAQTACGARRDSAGLHAQRHRRTGARQGSDRVRERRSQSLPPHRSGAGGLCARALLRRRVRRGLQNEICGKLAGGDSQRGCRRGHGAGHEIGTRSWNWC